MQGSARKAGVMMTMHTTEKRAQVTGIGSPKEEDVGCGTTKGVCSGDIVAMRVSCDELESLSD